MHEKKREFKIVFNLMLKYKSPKIFDFIKRVHLDIDFDNDMQKLLQINSFETVSYLMLKYGIYQKEKVFTNCMRILASSQDLESPSFIDEDAQDPEYL